LRYNGNEEHRQKAIEKLKKATIPYKELAFLWSTHYLPYKMVRTKYIFGYPYYFDEVLKDIKLATNIQF